MIYLPHMHALIYAAQDEVVARNKELLNSHKANVENLLKEVRRAADNRSQKTRDRTAAKVHLQGLQKSQRVCMCVLADVCVCVWVTRIEPKLYV